MSNLETRAFDKDNASREEYAAFNQLTNRMRLERMPNDPPVPLEETIQELQNIPSFVDIKVQTIWDTDRNEMVAEGHVFILRMEENRHLAQFDLAVLPEYRRQGLGKQLLRFIADVAAQENRRLLMCGTSDRVPGGEAFMMRLGAQKGLESHVNQLQISELNAELLNTWLLQGQANQAGFELGLWDGPYPEEKLVEIARLNDLTNQQPHGDLEIEDMHATPDELREEEKNIFARGFQRWVFYLVDRATSNFAGYTEASWNPNRPEIMQQGFTGVYPQYRNKGLGRWLKVAMLEKTLRELPQVKYVRTRNADSNAAMLKLNTALGFKPYLATALWQFDLQKAQEYLA